MSYTLIVTAAVALLVGHLIPRTAGLHALHAGARLAGAALRPLRRRRAADNDYDRRVRINDAVLRHAAGPRDAERLLLATAEQGRRQHPPR